MSRFCPEAHRAVREHALLVEARQPAAPYTSAELAACARREVRQRRRVYPRLVGKGAMTSEQAAHEIAMMEAIAADYAEPTGPAPRASGRLL